MQAAIEPDAALHVGGAGTVSARRESGDERRDGISIFRGNDRRGNHFDDFSGCAARLSPEVAGLLFVRHSGGGEPLFFVRLKRTHAGCVRRRDHRALGIQKTIEARVDRMPLGDLAGGRLVREQVAQFIARARVEHVERVVFERGVDAWLAHEHAAQLGERSVADVAHRADEAQIGGERDLQIVLRLGGDFALDDGQPGHRECHDHERHARKELHAECRDSPIRPGGRRDHGKSTRTVAPDFSSTGRSSVVLLSIHAFSL